MAYTALEQVIVGKMSLPEASGQISMFDLPESFAWLKHFSGEEMADFFAELLDALNQSQQTGDWVCVTEVLQSWKETASIKADSVVTASVKQGLEELAAGQGVSWAELKKEMGL